MAPRSGPDSRTSPAPSERLLELILVPVTGTTPGADAARSRVPTDKIARAPISTRSTRPAHASRHESSGRSRRGDGGRVGAGATSPRAPYRVRRAPPVGGIASVAARDSSRWPVGGGLSVAPWERRHRADASAAPRRAAPARRSSTSSANSRMAVLACGTTPGQTRADSASLCNTCRSPRYPPRSSASC